MGKERVLITGGFGFIGSNTCDYLIERGHQVVAFDDGSTGHNEAELEKHGAAKCTLVRGDIRKKEDLDKIEGPIDWVIHLAAAVSVAESMSQPEKYMDINVNGSRTVLEWAKARGVKKVVSASTAAYYGNPEVLPCKEEFSYAGISPYAEAKYKMEQLHEELSDPANGFVAGCCRFFNVYGPRQDPTSAYSGVISKFFFFATNNEPLNIFGDGSNTRDFVFVKDVSQGLELFLQKADKFVVYNIGNEKKTSLTELAKVIIDISGATNGVKHSPPREGDILHSVCSTERIRTDLGFDPKYPMEEGMKITFQWYKEFNDKQKK